MNKSSTNLRVNWGLGQQGMRGGPLPALVVGLATSNCHRADGATELRLDSKEASFQAVFEIGFHGMSYS